MGESALPRLRETMEQRRRAIASSCRRFRNESKLGVRDHGALDCVDDALNSYTKEFLLSFSNMDRMELHFVEEALTRTHYRPLYDI